MHYGIAKNIIPDHIRLQMIDLMDDVLFYSRNSETPETNILNVKADYFDNLFCGVHKLLIPSMESIWGKELLPTFNAARIYHNGSKLVPHIDRPSCEYGLTVNLSNENGIWPFFVKGPDSIEVQIDLQPGHGTYYKGLEVLHWRNKNVYGKCYQAMFFFVDKNGEYFDYEYDNRKKDWVDSYNNPMYQLDI